MRVYTVCHSICIIWTHYSMVEPHSSNFRVITTHFLGVRIFRKFTVSRLLPKEILTETVWNSAKNLQQCWKPPVSFDMCWIFQEYPFFFFFCQFYYRNNREQNRIFTQICEPKQKINQQTVKTRTCWEDALLLLCWKVCAKILIQ